MAGPIFLDLVKEITIITGTGNVTLLGASGAGFNTFYQAGKLIVGDTFYYVINPGQAEWEVGLGTLLTTTTFARSPTDSSNAGALVNFSAGTKVVALDAAAAALTSMLYDVIAIGRIPDLSSLYTTPAAVSSSIASALTPYSTTAQITAILASYATLTGIETLTNKTLTTPTISSLTNAQHTHLDAAGGGLLTGPSIGSGDIAAARIAAAVVGGTLAFSGTTGTLTGNFTVNSPQFFVNTTSAFVGVGTVSPGQKLDVVGSIRASSQIIASPGSSAAPGFAFNGDLNTGFRLPTDDTIDMITAGVGRYRIHPNGFVGIGFTSVPAALHQINTTSAAIIGSIVKGFASQTENLSEWRTSLDAVVASVSPTGSARFAGLRLDVTPTVEVLAGTVTIPISVGGVPYKLIAQPA